MPFDQRAQQRLGLFGQPPMAAGVVEAMTPLKRSEIAGKIGDNLTAIVTRCATPDSVFFHHHHPVSPLGKVQGCGQADIATINHAHIGHSSANQWRETYPFFKSISCMLLANPLGA